MNFELKFALTTLEQRTPDYFIREAFLGERVSDEVLGVLKTLGQEPAGETSTTRKLIERLSLV